MTIPATIKAEIAALQAQIAAAGPLQAVPQATLTALQLNAEQLVSDLGSALLSAAAGLDSWAPPIDAPSIASGVQALAAAAADQATLANARGFIGRVTSNLNQV